MSGDMTDVGRLTLPLRCLTCHRHVTLTYQGGETHLTQTWTCPYSDCHSDHTFDLRGRVVRTTVPVRADGLTG